MDDKPITWEDLPQFMSELRCDAQRLLRRESNAQSIQPTGLVLSALQRQRRTDQEWEEVTWQDRKTFLASAYRAMQQTLVDHARKRNAKKRLAIKTVQASEFMLENIPQAIKEERIEVEVLVPALETLRQNHPQWGEVVEHCLLANLTTKETGRIMNLSERQVRRIKARALLTLRVIMEQLINDEEIP